MAHAATISESALSHIARELAVPVASLFAPDARKSGALASERPEAGLADSFPVWLLTSRALKRFSSRVSDLARDTHVWHHQIRVGKEAVAYAESYRSPLTGEHEAGGVFPDPLAQAVDEAIDLIDEIDPLGDPEVRLLVAPEFDLTAFWLLGDGGSQFLVVDALGSRLPRGLILEDEFLRVVRHLPLTGGRLPSSVR
jgi:hypothetical protein